MKNTKKPSIKNIGIIATIGLLGLASSASAAVILGSTVSANNGPPQAGSLLNITNGSGLSSPLFHGDEVPGILPTHAGGAGDYPSSMVRWFTFNGTHPSELVFDLQDLRATVEDVILYNYVEGGIVNRGYTSVTASYSSDGISYTGAETLNFSASSDPIAGQIVPLTTQTFIRYVKFSDITGGDGSLIGLAEVRFTGTFAAPEPSSLALLGMGAVLLTMARRRQSASKLVQA